MEDGGYVAVPIHKPTIGFELAGELLLFEHENRVKVTNISEQKKQVVIFFINIFWLKPQNSVKIS